MSDSERGREDYSEGRANTPNGTNDRPARNTFLIEHLGINQALLLIEERYPEQHRTIRPWSKRIVRLADNRSWKRDPDGPVFTVVDLLAIAFDKSDPNTLDGLCSYLREQKPEDREIFKPDYAPDPKDFEHEGEFPVDALPAIGRRMVEAIVSLLNVSSSLPAAIILGVVGVALGCGLCVRSVFGLVSHGNLFILVGAETGSFKSVAFRFVAQVLYDFESYVRRSCAARVLVAKTRIREIQKELETLEGTNSESENGTTAKAKNLHELFAELARLEAETRIGNFLVDDATNEAIGPIAEANNGVVASVTPDARSAIDLLGGKYRNGKSTGEDLFLKGHGGEPLRIARRDRPPVETVLFLSVVWLTQPKHLRKLYAEEAFLESGLLGRFLAVECEPEPPPEDYDEVHLPADVKSGFYQRVWELMETFHQHRGVPFEISATRDARKVLIDYAAEVRQLIASFEQDEIKYIAVRLAEHAWRIGLGLHALEHGKNAHNHPLDVHTATNAVRIVRWFFVRTRALLEMELEHHDGVKLAVGRSYVSAHPAGITARDLYRHKQTLFDDSADAGRILCALADEGAIVAGDANKSSTRFYPRTIPKG